MYTIRYNGAYINGYTNRPECYVTTDCGRFTGRMFKSQLAAKQVITKARNNRMPESR